MPNTNPESSSVSLAYDLWAFGEISVDDYIQSVEAGVKSRIQERHGSLDISPEQARFIDTIRSLASSALGSKIIPGC
jgi:hypothetical protein